MAKTRTLHQVTAIDKGVTERAQKELTALHRVSEKPENYTGFNKVYTPAEENGLQFSPETKKVPLKGEEVLSKIRGIFSELVQIKADKDQANMSAYGDIVVNGEAVVKRVPVTQLLFLEKYLTDIRTLVSKMPVLDISEDWMFDTTQDLYKTASSRSFKTAKIEEPLVLYPATDKHPAQTQIITKDKVIGHWDAIKYSGALDQARYKGLLRKIDDLIQGVKSAREEANGAEVAETAVAQQLASYLFD